MFPAEVIDSFGPVNPPRDAVMQPFAEDCAAARAVAELQRLMQSGFELDPAYAERSCPPLAEAVAPRPATHAILTILSAEGEKNDGSDSFGASSSVLCRVHCKEHNHSFKDFGFLCLLGTGIMDCGRYKFKHV